MRRSAAAALIAVTALSLPVAAASAGPGSAVTVVSRSGLPAPLRELLGGSSCEGPGGTITHVAGPATPPIGNGSLAVNVPAHSYYGVVDYIQQPFGLSDLTSLSFATYQPPASSIPNTALNLFLELVTNPDTNGLYFVITLAIPPQSTATWQNTNVFGSGVEVYWTKYKRASDGSSSVIASDTQPFSTLAVDYPDAALSEINVGAGPGCGRPDSTFNLDDLVIGTDVNGDDTTTTYDFEPLITTTLHATAVTTKSGRTAVIHATMTAPAGSASGQPLTLWAKPATATAYAQIAAATTTSAGTAASTSLHPTVTTAYQWRYAGDADNAAASSKPVSIRVASVITLHAKAATATHHPGIRATGQVRPAHKGTAVTLWRSRGGHRVRLGHARERANGTYSITTRLPAGRYRVFVTAAKSRFNSLGTSATHTVAVP